MNFKEKADLSFYSREALLLARNVFSSRDIKLVFSAGTASVEISGEDPEKSFGEFLNEALNQQCRMDLFKKNSRIARIIVTKALLSAMGENGGNSK